MPARTSRAAKRCFAPGSTSRRARSACWPRSGSREIVVYRRPRVAIFSTGNEIVAPGQPLRPGAVYDSNAAIIGAAVEELGGVAVHLGVIPDDEEALASALARGLQSDVVVFSGGTSKGAGDLSYRVVHGACAIRVSSPMASRSSPASPSASR